MTVDTDTQNHVIWAPPSVGKYNVTLRCVMNSNSFTSSLNVTAIDTLVNPIIANFSNCPLLYENPSKTTLDWTVGRGMVENSLMEVNGVPLAAKYLTIGGSNTQGSVVLPYGLLSSPGIANATLTLANRVSNVNITQEIYTGKKTVNCRR